MTDTTEPVSTVVSPELQKLLQLFSSLPAVTFPELDPVSLQTDVARVKERHLEMLHIEAQLTAVRAALEEEQESLLKKGHRLHAYLAVYAESDEALSAKVETIALPRVKRTAAAVKQVEVQLSAEGEVAPAPKKRGRPRKTSTNEGLFGEPAAAEMPT